MMNLSLRTRRVKQSRCFLWMASLLTLLAMTAFAAGDDAKSLYDKAKQLEQLSDSLTEKAEKACYWGKSGGSACMEAQVKKFNAEYGAGSFEYLPNLNVIRYTGVHYQRLLQKYPDSSYAGEADFTLLSRNLVGNPDEVLPRVQAYLKRHPGGEWHCKGLLLDARLNQDIWWIHKKWSWVLYNWQVSEEDLIIKAEPYRREALKLFEQVSGECKGTDKEAAKKELSLLKFHKDDGRFYGIINETRISETKSPN